MTKRLLVVMLGVLFMCGLAFTQPHPHIERVTFPSEVRSEYRGAPDVDISGKVWNRWTSQNFVVCSLNDTQAKFLNEHLEKVKSWGLTRWGLPDLNFNGECRLICVDDAILYKKLFGLDKTKVELRKTSGDLKLSVIFILLNEPPAKTIPIPITRVALAEYEQQKKVKLGWWSIRGMCLLNGDLKDIRRYLVDLQTALRDSKEIYGSKNMLNMSEESFFKETPERQRLFDQQAIALCLLLRKEFGQDKFLNFIKESNPEKALAKVYRFESYDQFDRSYTRYMSDLSKEVLEQKTPDTYLQIQPKGN